MNGLPLNSQEVLIPNDCFNLFEYKNIVANDL